MCDTDGGGKKVTSHCVWLFSLIKFAHLDLWCVAVYKGNLFSLQLDAKLTGKPWTFLPQTR